MLGDPVRRKEYDDSIGIKPTTRTSPPDVKIDIKAPIYSVGTMVTISGLTSAEGSSYNQAKGFIESFSPESNRYTVTFYLGANKVTKSFKEENLKQVK